MQTHLFGCLINAGIVELHPQECFAAICREFLDGAMDQLNLLPIRFSNERWTLILGGFRSGGGEGAIAGHGSV
jgi:hypothetical protein